MGERDGSEFTLEMALWSSTILNSFIRDSKYVEMANYTFFVGGNGPIQVTEKGMLIQPEFYMMKLYADHLGDSLLESWNDVEKVTIDNPQDTRILSISVEDPDPAMAKLICRQDSRYFF